MGKWSDSDTYTCRLVPWPGAPVVILHSGEYKQCKLSTILLVSPSQHDPAPRLPLCLCHSARLWVVRLHRQAYNITIYTHTHIHTRQERCKLWPLWVILSTHDLHLRLCAFHINFHSWCEGRVDQTSVPKQVLNYWWVSNSSSSSFRAFFSSTQACRVSSVEGLKMQTHLQATSWQEWRQSVNEQQQQQLQQQLFM